jgi:hypothetical protein
VLVCFFFLLFIAAPVRGGACRLFHLLPLTISLAPALTRRRGKRRRREDVEWVGKEVVQRRDVRIRTQN